MTQYSDQYVQFKKKQMMLAGMLNESGDVIKDLNMEQFTENLKMLGEKVHNETFKIQIVGTFKNGKSTFINSFLGEDVLPAYSLPCTAVINEVKYGETRKAVLYFKNPLPEQLPNELSERALAHMRNYGMKDVPPMEIPYNEIEDYVVIPLGKDPKEMLLESPYEKVELFWPLELLKNGVEIIDSPGLNEAEARTRVTMDYLSKADAIIFVLSATALCSQEEMNFVTNNLKSQGFEDTFFVVNRFDLIPEKERARVMEYAKVKVKEYTSFGSDGVFFVSALNALNGKKDGNEELLVSSGMIPFEKRLSEFLTKQKGKAKLTQPARELKRILNDEALFKVIPRQREMLSSSLNDVKKRYEAAKPRLADAKLKKEKLLTKMMQGIEQAENDFRRGIYQKYNDISDSVPAIIGEYVPNTDLGLVPNKGKINAYTQELASYANDQIEKEQIEWKNKVLIPLLEEKKATIFDSVESDIADIFKDIDNVQVEVSRQTASDAADVPTWERVASAVGGYLLGGIGAGVTGASTGFSIEMLKPFAAQLGGYMLLGFIGCLNPITLTALLIGGAVYGGHVGKSSIEKKAKQMVIDQVTQKLTESAETNASSMTEAIVEKFKELANQIASAIDIEIREAENQIESVIAEMEKGEENVNERNSVLNVCEDKIKGLSTSLDNFIFQLIE